MALSDGALLRLMLAWTTIMPTCTASADTQLPSTQSQPHQANAVLGGGGFDPESVCVYRSGTATELWAAAKLAELLSVPLKYHTADEPTADFTARGGMALVGFDAATKLGGVAPAALSGTALPGDDSFYLSRARAVPDSGAVVIAASATSRRGTLNGVFAFLRLVGFDFLTGNATVVPPKPWSLPSSWGEPRTFTPPLDMRDMDTSTAADLGRRAFVGDKTSNNFSIYWPPSNYSASVGLDGFFAFPPVGGRVAQANWGWGGLPDGGRAGYVATAYDLLSWSLVADTSDCDGEGTDDPHPHNSPCLGTWRRNPEWFVCKPVTCDGFVCPALYPCTLDEVNRTFNSQPCWSNTSLQRAMAAGILRVLRKNPTATSVSVTGMDGSPVECPPDSVANKEENTTGGANFRAIQSIGAIVAQVCCVSRECFQSHLLAHMRLHSCSDCRACWLQEFPHVKLQTLAYQGSLSPPKLLRFGEQVVVQIAASIDQFVPLSHPKNHAVLELLTAWTKVVPTVYTWDYTCNFENTVIPFGSYYTQARHIKEMVALGVKGYYGEGCPHPGVDMIDLKT